MLNYKKTITTASLLAPVFVLILIWLPELKHYYVPGGFIDNSTINQLKTVPEQAVLQEISNLPLLDPHVKDISVLEQAERILTGELVLPGQAPVRIALPFDPEDLEKSTPSWQLSFAGLSTVRLLMEAYEQSGQERFFDLAKAMLLAWSEYESRIWMPRGFIWNDHAIAARLPVLSLFWQHYRIRSDFDTDDARSILSFALRSTQMLAKPEHFTYATNHGVMQNLGLWHTVVAFPELPGTEQFMRIAFDRMQAQMNFYINDEGVVLEHSAGYHAHGVYFLGSALRYLNLLNQPIPDEWQKKYQKAKAYYANLTRPDGTIPVFGDTPREHDARKSLTTDIRRDQVLPLSNNKRLVPQQEFTIHPFAGYSILWSGLENWQKPIGSSQAMITWSFFPGHGHKLADDMSVLLWADGRDWLSNIGYWPYGMQGREQAISWNGSNAPHLVGQPARGLRKTQLHYYGNSNELTVLDLERFDAGGFQPRRQLVYINQNLWLVLDSSHDKQSRIAEHVWSTLPDVHISIDPSFGGYWLNPGKGHSQLQATIQGSANVSVDLLSGSKEPFAGWMVMANRMIQKTQTLLVRQPSDMGWSLAIWKLVNEKDGSVLTGQPLMDYWKDAEQWRINIPLSQGELVIQRQGRLVSLTNMANKTEHELTLTAGPDVNQKFAAMQNDFKVLATDYPRYVDLVRYRWKVTYMIALFLLLQEVFLWLVKSDKVRQPLRYTSVLVWLFLGIWLDSVYFVT